MKIIIKLGFRVSIRFHQARIAGGPLPKHPIMAPILSFLGKSWPPPCSSIRVCQMNPKSPGQGEGKGGKERGRGVWEGRVTEGGVVCVCACVGGLVGRCVCGGEGGWGGVRWCGVVCVCACVVWCGVVVVVVVGGGGRRGRGGGVGEEGEGEGRVCVCGCGEGGGEEGGVRACVCVGREGGEVCVCGRGGGGEGGRYRDEVTLPLRHSELVVVFLANAIVSQVCAWSVCAGSLGGWDNEAGCPSRSDTRFVSLSPCAVPSGTVSGSWYTLRVVTGGFRPYFRRYSCRPASHRTRCLHVPTRTLCILASESIFLGLPHHHHQV